MPPDFPFDRSAIPVPHPAGRAVKPGDIHARLDDAPCAQKMVAANRVELYSNRAHLYETALLIADHRLRHRLRDVE